LHFYKTVLNQVARCYSWVSLISLVLGLSCELNGGLQAQTTELIGWAELPAATFAPGPTSGQLIPRDAAILPWHDRQPVQGFSAVLPGPLPGTYLALADNGFGARLNSGDFLLRLYGVQPDFRTRQGGSGRVYPVNWQTGQRLDRFTLASFLGINDAQRQIPFGIVADRATYPANADQVIVPTAPSLRAGRFLTGADFDPESVRQAPDGTFWLGEEFGPFLLQVNAQGRLVQPPIPLPNLPRLTHDLSLRSPDHPDFRDVSPDRGQQQANLPGSRGIEGMALNASGTHLYLMLEGPLVGDPRRDRLWIYEFDLMQQQFTGRLFAYRRAHQTGGQAIGDLTAINDREFLVIERDSRQGDPRDPRFSEPAQFKQIYRIDIQQLDPEGFVQKELVVDLLNIADPHNLGRLGTQANRFTFPFVTIESVLPLSAYTLLVINDNNYPFSRGRSLKTPDATEFILLRLEQPLRLDPRLVPGSKTTASTILNPQR